MSVLGEEAVTLLRRGAGSRDSDGRGVPGALTTSTIQASVQPLDGDDAATLPEGERASRWRKLYTETALRAVDQYGAAMADRVVIDGATFEVRTVARWRAVILHYRAFCARVKEGGA